MIFVYQVLGACPTTIGTTTNVIANGFRLLTVSHLLLATVQLVLVLFFHTTVFNPRDMFGLVNDTVKYCGVGFAYFTIVIESFVWRRLHVQFWRQAAKLQQKQHGERRADTSPNGATTPTNPTAAKPLSVDRAFLLQLGAYWMLAVLLETLLLPIIISMEPALRFWMMHRWTVTLSRLRHWQFVHYVRVVEAELRTIAVRMESIVRYAAYGGQASNATASARADTGSFCGCRIV